MNISEVVEAVIEERIALLAQIIANAPEDEPVWPAIIQLGSIGTKEASDTLMRLTEQCTDPVRQTYMGAALIVHSPFRSIYFAKLMHICSDPLKLLALHASTLACDQRLCRPPLWQEIVEVVEKSIRNEQQGFFDPAVGD